VKKSILILLLCAILLAGCNNSGDDPVVTTEVTEKKPADTTPPLTKRGDTYVITEERYVEGVNEISTNREKYIGQRIEVEGEYMAELYVDEMYYSVYRNIIAVERHEDEDGHVHTHTHDSYKLGFRIKHDANNKPSSKTFVKVSGILETYEQNGEEYLIINADYLKKSDNPGKVYLRY